jgi:hypothetical protein
MKVFGEIPPGPSGEKFELVETPVGEQCAFCGATILPTDTGCMVPIDEAGSLGPQHKWCTAVEMYQVAAEERDRAREWARLWKRAARRWSGYAW